MARRRCGEPWADPKLAPTATPGRRCREGGHRRPGKGVTRMEQGNPTPVGDANLSAEELKAELLAELDRLEVKAHVVQERQAERERHEAQERRRQEAERRLDKLDP